MSVSKITEAELADMMLDLAVTDEELQQYLQIEEDPTGAFVPVLRPNPKRVKESDFESAVFLNVFNELARRRRNLRYRKRVKNWQGVKVVAEGDSWFQYPIFLTDTIDHLTNLEKFDYAIYCASEAGDLLENMVLENELSQAVADNDPDVVLLSGGGNDMVGKGRLLHMIHSFDKKLRPEEYPNEKFSEFLDKLEELYRRLFDRLLRMKPHLKLVVHGYDFVLPDNGKWLGKPLKKAKINSVALQKKIAKEFINRFNERLIALQEEYKGSVFYADCRGLITKKKDWYDELHPSSEAFLAVAEKFDECIKRALSSGGLEGSVNLPKPLYERVGQSMSYKVPPATIANLNQLSEKKYSEIVHARAEDVLRRPIAQPKNIAERRAIEQEMTAFLEKVHRESNFLPSSFLELGVQRAQAVCRIVTETTYGSGFLIATRDYVMTNNHVISTKSQAAASIAEFDYDEDDELYTVRFDPDRLFITDRELDFTIIACESAGLPQSITPLPFLRDPATVTRNERVNIIQHPSGRSKELAIHDNKVSYVYDRVLRYTTDTEPGSSGSPVFNNQWDLVAIHHAGWEDNLGGATNEGVRMGAIAEFLMAQTPNDPDVEALTHAIADTRSGAPEPTARPALKASSGHATLRTLGSELSVKLISDFGDLELTLRK